MCIFIRVNEKLLTTAEVAAKLKVTRWRVNAMIRDKRLKATRFGQIYLIQESDLQEVKNRKAGRPKGTTKKAA